jgi:hypothetical protein
MFGMRAGWQGSFYYTSAAKRFAELKRLDIDKIGSQSVSLAKRFAVTPV